MTEAPRFPSACVASPHYLASSAGLRVLASGGNALDAAVAANLTLAVVAPYLCGVGGDVFALVWVDGEVHGYCGDGRAPAAATPEAVREAAGDGGMPERGPLTVTVPGAVQGWFDLLERFGSRAFGELARSARTYAEDGFVLSGQGALVFELLRERLGAFEGWKAVYGDAAGREVLRQPDLARTIDTLAREGPDAFYRGEIASAIVECVQDAGGLLQLSDLAAHRGEWVEPLRAPYRDLEVLELPPPTQGVTALEALRMVDRQGSLPLNLADRHHLLIEAMKLALRDRQAYVTDPEHMSLSPAQLLADRFVDERLARIDPARASTPEPGRALLGGTAYFCAADATGMLVSLIQTNYQDFGSGLTVPAWGINLHNRGAMFSLDPESANVIAPGKRTLHTLIPAMALRGDRPWLVFGTMGADAQAQVQLQFLTQVVDEGTDLLVALGAPRWRIVLEDWSVAAETRFEPALLDALRERGHAVVTTIPWDWAMGHAHALAVEEAGYAAAADPRSEGMAVGF